MLHNILIAAATHDARRLLRPHWQHAATLGQSGAPAAVHADSLAVLVVLMAFPGGRFATR